MILYGHPFSSYTWKALIAFYEKALPFEFAMIDPEHPDNVARLSEIWPLNKFPVLEEGGAVLIESSVVIEHLDLHYPATPRLIPADPKAALNVRFMDRVFDNHVMGMMQAIGAVYLPEVSVLLPFIFMIAILIWKPSGLAGSRT